MKPTRTAYMAGGFGRNLPLTPNRSWAAREIGSAKTPTLAERLQARRAAERDEGREPVDIFCSRGEIARRFAYFD